MYYYIRPCIEVRWLGSKTRRVLKSDAESKQSLKRVFVTLKSIALSRQSAESMETVNR